VSIEEKLFKVLTTSTVINTKVSTANINPDHRNQDDSLPAIDYQRTGGHRVVHLGGYAGLENGHYNVNIYTSDIDSRRVIGEAVIEAMSSSVEFSAQTFSSPIDDFDDELNQFIRTLEFSIWNRE